MARQLHSETEQFQIVPKDTLTEILDELQKMRYLVENRYIVKAPEYVTIAEFVRLSGLGRDYVRALMRQEGFPSYRKRESGHPMIDLRAALAWCKVHAFQAEEEPIALKFAHTSKAD